MPHDVFEEDAASGGSVSLVTLAASAPYAVALPESHGAKRDGTTDDSAAIQAAIDAVVAAGQANGTNYGEVWFTAGIYAINNDTDTTPSSNTPTAANVANLSRSQIRIPNLGNGATKTFTLVLKGTTYFAARPYFQSTSVQNSGATLLTNLNRAWNGTYGHAAMIGGPTEEQQGAGNPFANVCLVIDGLNLSMNAANNGMLVNGMKLGQVHVRTATFDGGVTTQESWSQITGDSYGLVMPNGNNENNCEIESVSVLGLAHGISPGEHTHCGRAYIWGCNSAIYDLNLGPHFMVFDYLSIENCHLYIEAEGESGPALAQFNLIVHCFDVEDNGTSFDSGLVHIKDPSNGVCGEVRYQRYNTDGPGGTQDIQKLIVNGARQLRVYDLRQIPGAVTAPGVPATTVALLNPFDRDALVSVAGTLTGIAVDGTTVLTGAGTVMVPSRRTITLTYSTGTPTWVWTLN